MNVDNINLIQTCDACPEQYDAVNDHGQIIGYIRVRWGYCVAWCPDAESNIEVYRKELRKGHGLFANCFERKRNLRKAKKAIALWWTKQNLTSPAKR